MSVWKRILLFLAVFLLMLGAVCVPFHAQLPAWIATLRNSWDGQPYQIAACGAESSICAARIGENGTLELRLFDPTNKRSLEKWEVTLPQEASEGELCMVYPVGNTSVYFGVYEKDARYLSLFWAQKNQPVERLLREECPGDSATARRSNRFFSEVTQQQDTIRLTLLTEDTVILYSHRPDSGLQMERTLERNGALSAVGVDNVIYRGENAEIELTYVGNGIFYLDGSDLTVRYADLSAEMKDMSLLRLSEHIGDHQVTSVSLFQDGSALLLLDGHTLKMAQENSVQDLTDRLYPSFSDCAIRVAALLIVVLILSIALWWLMAGRSRGRVPLAIYWGVVSLAAILLIVSVLFFATLTPARQGTELMQKMELTDDIVDLAQMERSLESKELPDLVYRALDSTNWQKIRGARVVAIHRENGNWYLPSGVRAELDPGIWISCVNNAEARDGAAVEKMADRFWYATQKGNNGLMVSYHWEDAYMTDRMEDMILLGFVCLAAVTLVILTIIGLDVRKTSRGLECYATDQPWSRVRVSGGDELEGMASTLNSLAAERREEERRRERFITSYRRFVPEEILKLLGKRSVLDVDQDTIVSRRMAVMRVSFRFTDPVYTKPSNIRLMFDSVNEVIERTAPIVRQKGGVVFNIAYSGYDVVMEQDSRQVISTAVAVRQEILAFNEQQAQNALPTVTLRIAIDEGGVILGIVGDQAQLEPSAVSDSWSTLFELLKIADVAEANILCTETIIAGAEGYSSRYMGKCRVGDHGIRVYEIFDGDPYDVRKGKEASVRQFSEGVLSLYSGEIAHAKRVFLELVRDAPRDGGARYYLYLADRLTEDDAFNGVFLNGRMEMEDDRT